jgi:hypothetical protein
MTPAVRVLLVVTGVLERVALAQALGRVFPSAVFETTQTQGFTSNRLPPPDGQYQDSKAADIVEELLGAALPKEPGGPGFDFAVAVEDVELANELSAAGAPNVPADQGIEHILAHLRLGIDTVLQQRDSLPGPIVLPKGKAKRAPGLDTDDERRRFLRERCSFHLLRPLAEALFFGEPNALLRTADPGVTLPAVQFDAQLCDIEAFQTADAGYLAKPCGAAPWAKDNRERHPKHYVAYLLDPTGTIHRPYKEPEHGKRALATLDWQTVVTPTQHARMVRSLLADVADMLGVHLPWLQAGACHPLTERKINGVLRNIA